MKRTNVLFCFFFATLSLSAQSKIIVGQEEAWGIVKQSVLGNKIEGINVDVSSTVLPPASIIKTLGKVETSPDFNSWAFFVDDRPFGNWKHPCRYIYVNAENGQCITHKHSMPPYDIDMDVLVEQLADTTNVNQNVLKKKDGAGIKTLVSNSTLRSYAYTHNYAVIINGGINYKRNHLRYWNDCAAIYSTLVNVYGYNRNHIYVIMSDGVSSAIDRHKNNGYDSSPLDLDGDGTNDIQYAATYSNISGVFSQLSNILTEDNNLFIFTMDHGDIDGNDCLINLWNYEELYDYDFENMLSNINAGTVNICMGQCSSGGFIDNIPNNKYVISTACRYDEDSYPLTSSYDGYDAFVYYWTAAVRGQYPDGSSANADTNNDGFVSMREAFNYANALDSNNETPQLGYSSSGLENRLNLFAEMPNTISGPSLISSSACYSIPNLPAGMTVTWASSNSHYKQNCLQQNTPSINKCTITRSSSQDMTNATLTAVIKHGGVPIDTITKQGLYAYAGFKGTYYNGQTTKQVNLPNPLYVKPNVSMWIQSPNLINSSVSLSGSFIPSYWNLNTTTGKLTMSTASTTGQTTLVTATCDNGDVFYLPVMTTSNNNQLNLVISEGSLEVSLVPIDYEFLDSQDVTTNSDVRSTYSDKGETPVWTLEVYNATTGEKVFGKEIEGTSFTIDTTGWKPGVYVVRAVIGDEVLNEKVIVK